MNTCCEKRVPYATEGYGRSSVRVKRETEGTSGKARAHTMLERHTTKRTRGLKRAVRRSLRNLPQVAAALEQENISGYLAARHDDEEVVLVAFAAQINVLTFSSQARERVSHTLNKEKQQNKKSHATLS